MKLAVVREKREAEKRVAATPETIKKLKGLGFDVHVEAGAGQSASIPDDAFKEAGATISADIGSALDGADVIFSVQGIEADDAAKAKKGALQLAVLNPFVEKDRVKAYADAGLMAVAMEFVPRITRAQSMDVLSSQSNLAGYKAVLDAAAEFSRAFPMMMTAAGTVAPAKVMVMGAGVAGLQAIATAKRLGAVVSATDVRPAAKEQVESLGGTFVMVEDEETAAAETSGGYAKEMSDDYKAKQAALIAETLAKQDIAITTALIPGRPAPKLITEEMLKTMKPGSVIVDLAVEMGGNCALSKPGEIVEAHGVKIVGHLNVPSRLATDASALYARNLVHYITPHVKEGALEIDFEDEVVAESLITKDGAVVSERLQEAS
ncbi:Re/Si-specific NAD(P)(+) transhydrogenase subunit alpha [Kordiimonas sp. SCSIO 12603]|uniref:Re/Si-specific NAD(P)(+) transhydrogenase subunit alpha n=1 Tax=Kordiimonas sp. SCSIO 12603 TaxID=2829596 RepID=UPI002104EC3B|nr:Re/Si-specific NAD(P)(+) transhydrogenase subunit alpha [Kordiimonas sp. SCSIO 12603]UTW59672.1 Re/Si-specific NAD(P)(+) transhydrogenase subunit alpha [Kordiimonas sp. SCSIO 12603]